VEASLFRGGILLLASLGNQATEIETRSSEITAGDDLSAVLTGFAERA
jgi:hypothetical protein